jgi:hypothetical protein
VALSTASSGSALRQPHDPARASPSPQLSLRTCRGALRPLPASPRRLLPRQATPSAVARRPDARVAPFRPQTGPCRPPCRCMETSSVSRRRRSGDGLTSRGSGVWCRRAGPPRVRCGRAQSRSRLAAGFGDRTTAMAAIYGRDADRAKAQGAIPAGVQKRIEKADWKLTARPLETAAQVKDGGISR